MAIPFLGGGLNHDSNSTKNSSGVNQFTQGQYNSIWQQAQNAAKGGPGQNLDSAGQYSTDAQNAGSLGMNALSGDQNSVNKLMNPYINSVVNANNAAWNNINAGTANASNEAATGANAFGGSRAAVAQGAALSQNNIAQAQQNADLFSQGYQGAMNQAMGLSGLGFQGANLNTQLGFGGVGNGLFGLNALRQGFMGVSGTNSDTEQHQTGYGINGGAMGG